MEALINRIETSPATTSVLDGHYKRLLDECKGWGNLRSALFDLSSRWQWWALALMTKQLPPMPYPRIHFADNFSDHDAPMRMIRECLAGQEHRFSEFLDYLLFLFDDFDVRKLPKSITVDDIRYWHKAFDLKVLMDFPGDWLGHYYETNVISSSMRSSTGYFSTPPAICRLMVEIAHPKLTDSLSEPCVGSGRILMEASNFCLHLSGQDVNPVLCKIATVNSWLYMPSVVMPCQDIAVTNEVQLDRKIKNTFIRRKQNDYRGNQTRVLSKDRRHRESLFGSPCATGNSTLLPALPVHSAEKL